MDKEINAKFENLPTGYSYKLFDTVTRPNGYNSYRVTLITPSATEVPLAGLYDRPMAFASEPDKVYALGDVRDSLVKREIGDEIAFQYHLHGFDKRTGEYLDACKSALGLLDTFGSDNLTINDDWERLDAGAFNSSDIYCKKVDQGFLAAFQVQFSVDGFWEHRFIFDKKPNRKMILDAHLIDEIRRSFKMGEISESFTCWECGCEIEHWLDIDGDLRDKWDNLKEKYCGC